MLNTAKYRNFCDFVGCSGTRKLGFRGGESPLTLLGALSLDPAGAPPPDPSFTLALRACQNIS